MVEIKLKNRTFKIHWDAKAMFRYSKEGGSAADISALEAKGGDHGRDMFIVALLFWAALADEFRAEFPQPIDVAPLLVPFPEAEVAGILGNEIARGSEEMVKGGK